MIPQCRIFSFSSTFPGSSSASSLPLDNERKAPAIVLPSASAAADGKQQQQQKKEEDIVVLHNVQKTYLLGIEGVPAVRGVSCRIKRGEFVLMFASSLFLSLCFLSSNVLPALQLWQKWRRKIHTAEPDRNNRHTHEGGNHRVRYGCALADH